jgi:ComF family protein
MFRFFKEPILSPLKQHCVLCERAESDVLCLPCQRDLPRVDVACIQCAAPGQLGVCGACIAAPPAFDSATAAFTYRFPVDKLVQSFKFRADLTLTDFFADSLAAKIANHSKPLPYAIVAMPLGRRRLAVRGFNQSAILADAVARRLGIRVARRSMLRIRETAPQAGLSREARLKNIKGAFDCKGDVAGKHIALVDDVMTTGATLSEAASALKRAGAARVEAWVLARAVFDESWGDA